LGMLYDPLSETGFKIIWLGMLYDPLSETVYILHNVSYYVFILFFTPNYISNADPEGRHLLM